MRTKTLPGGISADSNKLRNCTFTHAASAADSISGIPQNAGNIGDPVHVKGLGKHGFGVICSGTPIPGYTRFRCHFNKGEHLVKSSNVTVLGRKEGR